MSLRKSMDIWQGSSLFIVSEQARTSVLPGRAVFVVMTQKGPGWTPTEHRICTTWPKRRMVWYIGAGVDGRNRKQVEQHRKLEAANRNPLNSGFADLHQVVLFICSS